MRAKENPPLDPLPDEKGKICPGLEAAQRGGEVSPFASNPERREEEKTTEDEDEEGDFDDPILKDALERGR